MDERLKKLKPYEPVSGDFSSRLDELNTELGALSRDNSSQSMSSVVSPISGYYVGSVDGYEEHTRRMNWNRHFLT